MRKRKNNSVSNQFLKSGKGSGVKLLIVPGYSESFGDGNANLICLEELMCALGGYADLEIDVAGTALRKEDAVVRISNPLQYAKKIVNWPIINPAASDKCYKEIVERLKTQEYDAILVMYNPYDAVVAAMRAKRKFPHVRLFLYELDQIANEMDKQRKSLGRYLYIMRVLAEKKTFRNFDRIFHMECNRKKYDKKKYDKYRCKFEYLDFPLIHNHGRVANNIKEYSGQMIKLIYTGKIMKNFRSPEYLLKVLIEVERLLPIEVKFFSSGDCEGMISEFALHHSFIKQCGYVDKQTLQMEMGNSNCLINIGNKMSDMLPSKVLTYIETGMPILHVKNQENDACIPYLEKYELALLIDESDPVEVSVEKTIAFLRNSIGKRLDSKWIIETYYKNTPEFSARKIYDLIC